MLFTTTLRPLDPRVTEVRLDETTVEELWTRHAMGVRRFVMGVLRDDDGADEAVQQAFVTLVERGHHADPSTIKGWLYKVAFHHAIGLKRQQSQDGRACENIRDSLSQGDGTQEASAAERAIHNESIAELRAAIERLPAGQREVVLRRVRDGMKFSEIADELQVPLSTALTRMQAALAKLRNILK